MPFRRSTRHHREGPFYQTTVTLGASATVFPPIPVAAYGFLRGIWVNVSATAASNSASVAFTQDGPFNALAYTLQDVNNAPIYGPLPAGLYTFLTNKYGAYRFAMDPRANNYFATTGTGSAGGSFNYWLYVPVEMLSRSGLGSITNLNAAAAYQLVLTLQPESVIYSTSPTDAPSVTVSAYLDAWQQPPAHDVLGNTTTQTPPALNTTQFWSLSSIPVQSGYQTPRLTRLGYYLRNLVFVFVNGSTNERDETDFPDPAELWVDGVLMEHFAKAQWRQIVYNDYGYVATNGSGTAGAAASQLDTANGQDSGVFPYTFADDFELHPGQELRNGYMPTLESSRIELRGTFGVAGTLYVLTNDVAPAGSIFVRSTL